MEGNNYIVTWAIGHLVTLAMPQQYGVEGFRKEDLPLLPEPFRLIVRQIRKDGEYINDPAAVKQLGIIKNCFNRSEKIIVLLMPVARVNSFSDIFIPILILTSLM